MVSGLGTPDQREFTHPSGLTEELRRSGYRINPLAQMKQDGAAAFAEDVFHLAEMVTETTLHLFEQLDWWDFGMAVLRLTDEVPHYFWHWMDETHPAHQPADPCRE